MSATHLRVYERQGPCMFERSACGLWSEDVFVTPVARNVTCAKCKKTRFFAEAGGKRSTHARSGGGATDK